MDCITVEVIRKPNEAWGIQVAGEAPCYIDSVKRNSPAEEAGIQKGDCIFSVNGVSVHDASHAQVVQLIGESGRMARFKLLPNNDEEQMQSTMEEEKFWTKEDPKVLKEQSTSIKTTSKKETFDRTDYENFCKILETNSKLFDKNQDENVNDGKTSDKSKTHKQHKKKKKKKKKIEIDQTKFVVTREDQKDFDQNYAEDCAFKGKKAAVAGAFTGDHNVILDEKNSDVKGIRARVIAGIQHFSFADEQDKINPEDKGKIIVYTTSLGIHRSIAQSCEQVRKLLKAFRVKFEDRDIFNFPEYKDNLYRRLGLSDGAPFPEIPRVYIDGVYVGGAEEVQAMSDCGDLRIRLQEFPKYNIRSKCPTCSATGSIVCHSCKGKAFKKKTRFASLKCGTCNQTGTLQCPDCLS